METIVRDQKEEERAWLWGKGGDAKCVGKTRKSGGVGMDMEGATPDTQPDSRGDVKDFLHHLCSLCAGLSVYEYFISGDELPLSVLPSFKGIA